MQTPNSGNNLYSIFCSPMDGRTFSSEKYRFGFNGQEKDDEVAGAGNINTAMFWEYDTRLGRRWNLDPKPNASISRYSCLINSPLWCFDVLGDTIGVNLFKNHQGESQANLNAANGMIHNKDVNDGTFIIFAHGGSGVILYYDHNGVEKRVETIEDFNAMMKERCPQWEEANKNGKKTVLIILACNVASQEYQTQSGRVVSEATPIADKISKAYPNSTVIAPDGYCLFGEIAGKPTVTGISNATNSAGFIGIKNGIRYAKLVFNKKLSSLGRTVGPLIPLVKPK